MAIVFDIQTILTYLTLISIPIGVFYHILTLRNQSKARQIQILRGLNLIETDFTFLDNKYTDYDDYMLKYGPETNLENWRTVMFWFTKLEELGVYVKEGLIDIRMVYLLMGGTIKKSYEILQVLMNEYRKQHNWSRWLIEAEYLCKKIIEYEKQNPEYKT